MNATPKKSKIHHQNNDFLENGGNDEIYISNCIVGFMGLCAQ